jgi:hypothetical protein
MFSCLGVKDFTGDGLADAIGGGSSNGETEGKVFGIDGADGSIEWEFPTAGTSVWALEQLNDVNGKGVQEIIAGDFGGHIYIINPENGSQLHHTTAGNNLIIRFAKLDDINMDGHPDILLGYSGTNGVLLSGFDLSTIWVRALADMAWVADRITDVNGDSINDAIIGTLSSDNYCYFMDGISGDELHAQNYGTPLDAIRSIPDIVGDFSMEMVAGGRDGKVVCYSGGINAATDISEPGTDPESLLADCWPNPVAPGRETRISYSLEYQSYVEIQIYNMEGTMVNMLSSGKQQEGLHEVSWDGTSSAGSRLPAGLYFCRISSEKRSTTLKIALL